MLATVGSFAGVLRRGWEGECGEGRGLISEIWNLNRLVKRSFASWPSTLFLQYSLKRDQFSSVQIKW